MAHGAPGEVAGEHRGMAIGSVFQQPSPRYSRRDLLSTENRVPFGLCDLQRAVHDIPAEHDQALPRIDTDAHMPRAMAWRWMKFDAGQVFLAAVIDRLKLPRIQHRLDAVL